MRYIRKYLKKIIVIISLIIIITLIILKLYLYDNLKFREKEEETNLEINEITIVDDLLKEEEKEEVKEEVKNIFVDIKGAILNPGVYEIEENKKVIDVVNLAGGLAENADTSLINLAKKVTDEMVVIVYTKEEVELAKKEDPIIKIIEKECVCPEIKNDACLDKVKNEDEKDEELNILEKININTATLEELLKLSGIGESKAKAIIAYREEVGKFNSIEEIKQVQGIGDTLYESIKDNITI